MSSLHALKNNRMPEQAGFACFRSSVLLIVSRGLRRVFQILEAADAEEMDEVVAAIELRQSTSDVKMIWVILCSSLKDFAPAGFELSGSLSRSSEKTLVALRSISK